jgi:hypothetical protein
LLYDTQFFNTDEKYDEYDKNTVSYEKLNMALLNDDLTKMNHYAEFICNNQYDIDLNKLSFDYVFKLFEKYNLSMLNISNFKFSNENKINQFLSTYFNKISLYINDQIILLKKKQNLCNKMFDKIHYLHNILKDIKNTYYVEQNGGYYNENDDSKIVDFQLIFSKINDLFSNIRYKNVIINKNDMFNILMECNNLIINENYIIDNLSIILKFLQKISSVNFFQSQSMKKSITFDEINKFVHDNKYNKNIDEPYDKIFNKLNKIFESLNIDFNDYKNVKL